MKNNKGLEILKVFPNGYRQLKCNCGTKYKVCRSKYNNSPSCQKCKNKRVSGINTRKNREMMSLEDSLTRMLYKDKRYYMKKKYPNSKLISLKYFTKLINENCEYCGSKPSNICKSYRHGEKHLSMKYQGIDRIDSNKGYVNGNVVPCCKICNIMKNELGLEEFLNHIRKIYKYNNLCYNN